MSLNPRLKALSPKVGAVLFQLPPLFSKNRERLASFLHMLPRCYPYAFEFRHKSWYDDDIYQLLRARDVALCLAYKIIHDRERAGLKNLHRTISGVSA